VTEIEDGRHIALSTARSEAPVERQDHVSLARLAAPDYFDAGSREEVEHRAGVNCRSGRPFHLQT